MRPLEIILPILLALYLIWRHPRLFFIRLLPTAALILTLIHLVVEAYRWQMIPLYVLTILLAITSWIKLRSSTDWSPITSYLTLILLAVSTALPIVLPVPSLPAASGPYQVGTRIYELTDPSRQETYSGKDEARRFQIQVWYPADVRASDERAPWMQHADIYAPAISTYIHLPSFFLDHLALVKMPAFKDSGIAPANEAYPVILF